MRYSVRMILDIPYASFTQKTVRITAESLEDLFAEAIPQRACREVEVLRGTEWKRLGWKHVNMKFCCHGIQIEFVFDQEKKNAAAVYILDDRTGEVLSRSDPPVEYYDRQDEGRLVAEVKALLLHVPIGE